MNSAMPQVRPPSAPDSGQGNKLPAQELSAQELTVDQASTHEESAELRLRMLEIEYQALETHANALQKQLNLIHDSRFWRLTRPLRFIFSLLRTCKNKAGLALTSTAAGRKIYRLIKPSALPESPPAPQLSTQSVKEQHTAAAVSQLHEFLASGKTLRLPCAEHPRVSIILVLFNQAPLTLLCLESLLLHAGSDIEVIIVDNNSTDQSSQLLAKTLGAKVICNPDNLGFVHAVNQGAHVASGQYLLLLNNDALLQAGSLDAALHVFASEDNVGAVGGKINLLDGSLQEAGSIIWQDGSCLGYGRGESPERPEFMFRRDVDYCSGAFFLTPRALFEQLGGFDTDYAPAYYEESDYCIRLNKAGYRIVYEPLAQITHYEFASSGGYAGASRLQQEHREILLAKHQTHLEARLVATAENILAARTASRAQRVLVIDDRVPHANLGSGYPRCREIIHELVAMDFSVTLYPLRFPVDDWSATYTTLPARVEVMLDMGTKALEEFLVQRQAYYDCILVSRNHNMELFLALTQKNPALTRGSRIIYDAEALVAPREAARLRLAGEIIPADKEQVMVEAEIELARNADWVIAVSETEADIYRKSAFPNVLVLGHKSSVAPTGQTFNERQDLLFVGALRDDNSPNVDSILWFCAEVLPLLRKQLGQTFQVLIVGGNSAPSLTGINAEGVRFLGQHDDITALYDHSRIFIAPTRFAAGIPHKVHEAAAHGVPVVATQLLADQLSWQHNKELLCASDAQHFAAQCARLYTDELLWNQLRDNALMAVQRDCSPQTFRQRLRQIFTD